jgi:hypothetical protein
MTGVTIVNNIPMIERCAHKCICCEMAERAILSSRQMIVGKASTDHTVMAGCAIAAYIVVVKDAGGKNAGSMAYTTILGGRHMVVRLTSRVSTVMAGSTQFIYDTWHRMIESLSPGESASIVAHATISVRGRVIRCLACRLSAIVTSFTISSNSTVVKDNGLKIIYDMT